ncbi:MAG: hypothetical protein L0323_06545 [Planctomycetes bacterium]|nr:hypothetical protein [Planctomycetota bacterium]
MVQRFRTLLVAGLSGATLLAPAPAQPCAVSTPVQSYIRGVLPPSFVALNGQPGTTVAIGSCLTTTSVQINLPFTFTFFGQAKTLARIQKNGFLHFTNFVGFANTGNITVPNSADPDDLIAPFWDVLVPAPGTGGVLYRTDGAAPNRIFTVEWRDMMIVSGAVACFDNGSRLNFQARLFEADGSIQLHYGPFAAGTVASLISATIGLEDSTGAVGIDVTSLGNLNPVFPTTAFRFYPGAVSNLIPTYTVTTPAPSFSSIAGAPGATQAFCPPPCVPGLGGACVDDEGVNINLTFPFSFWGEAKVLVEMSMNGIATFDLSLGTNGAGNPGNPIPFPNPATPNDWAAPWWEDLELNDPAANTGGWWLISGSAPNRVLTMEWVNLSRFTTGCVDSGDRINCQMEFREAGNLVVMKYGTQVIGAGPNDASVGVENKTGTVAVDGTGNGPNNSTFPTTDLTFTPCSPNGVVLPFGNGCPGGLAAAPTIGSAGGAPVIGNATFALTMTGGPANSLANGLVLGASNTTWLVFNLPMALGIFGAPACTLFTSADIILSPIATDPAGFATITLPIPNQPSIVGGSVFAQFFSPFTPTLAMTNGAEVRIG